MIVEGRAEVTSRGDDAPITLATLGAGELCGEIALLASGARRQATVRALTPLRVLVIPGPPFAALVDGHPELRSALDGGAEDALIAKFLKMAASPFAALDPDHFRALAARLEPVTVQAGATVVAEGDPGDSAYLVRSGEVEVVTGAGTPEERRLTTLGRGTLFGEAALLTDGRRNATVRATTECELLRLRRADLLDAMGTERVAAKLADLVQLRARPRRRRGVVAEQRTDGAGETLTVLKDRKRGAYYRLSPQGYFVWQQLDGHHTLRDLTLAYMREFKSFAPQAITQLLSGLAAAGFVFGTRVRRLPAKGERPPAWQRVLLAVRRVLEWKVVIRKVDPKIGRIYRTLVRPLYTRVGQVALAALALSGLAAFFLAAGDARATLERTGPLLLLVFLPAQLLALVVHEAGHAFTTKHFGREVLGVGVGWYWFGPVAFVDTSDMWLEGRWPRIAVSLAGPYTNLLLGSACALLALVLPGTSATAAWQLALSNYLMVFLNLDPLLEYDGYYVLADLLDRPNLRPKSLQWLGRELGPALRTKGALRAHLVELSYGLGAIAYVVVMAGMTLVLYRVFLHELLARVMPEAWASGLAWSAVALVVLATSSGVIVDLRGLASPNAEPERGTSSAGAGVQF